MQYMPKKAGEKDHKKRQCKLSSRNPGTTDSHRGVRGHDDKKAFPGRERFLLSLFGAPSGTRTPGPL